MSRDLDIWPMGIQRNNPQCENALNAELNAELNAGVELSEIGNAGVSNEPTV